MDNPSKTWKEFVDKGISMLPNEPTQLCDHEYREVSVTWDPVTGKLWQKLECDKCGHVSRGWTLPDENKAEDD